MKNDFYFNNENGENIPPDSFNEEIKMENTEMNFSKENENIVENNTQYVNNTNNVINNQNPTYNAQNQQYQPYFQPNYYSYQHSYQQVPNNNYINSKEFKLYLEKKEFKRTANFIGIGLLLFYAFSFVISYVLGAFLSVKEIADFINDPAGTLGLNVILSVLGFGLSSIFILKAQGLKAADLISYGPPKKETVLPAILTAVGFCYTANIAVTLLQDKFQNILPFAQPELALPSGGLGFALSVLSVAVAPALIEEFLFRSVIMGSLLKYGKGFAIFTSAFLFALVHGNLIQIPFAFLVGLVIGAMVVETESIWTGVIIHFLNNFLSVCMDYISQGMSEDIIDLIFLFLVAFLMIIGIIGFYILSKKNKDLFKFDKTEQTTSMKKFGWLCSTASIIVYCVIVFLEILAVQFMSSMM